MKHVVMVKYWNANEECEEIVSKLPFDTKIEAYDSIKNMYKDKFEDEIEVIKNGVKYTVIFNRNLKGNYSEYNIELLWGKPNSSWYFVKEIEE